MAQAERDDVATQVAAVRAAWFLNKPNPVPAEEAEYRDKGFDTKDGFFAALALLREAVGLIESIPDGGWHTPRQRRRAASIVASYDAATRPVAAEQRAGDSRD